MKEKNNNGKKISPQILVPMIIGAICVITILVVVGFVTPKKATAGQLQENLNLGSKYLEAGEYDKAEVAFNDALKIDKKSTDATLGLAKVYNGKKQPEKALDMLKTAGKNMKNTSKSSLKKNASIWNSRVNDYQRALAETKSLFEQQGNTSQVKLVEKEEKTVIKYVTRIINITSIVTPTPEPTIALTVTPKSDRNDDNGSDAKKGSGKKTEPQISDIPDPEDPTDPDSPTDPDNPTNPEEPTDPMQNSEDDDIVDVIEPEWSQDEI